MATVQIFLQKTMHVLSVEIADMLAAQGSKKKEEKTKADSALKSFLVLTARIPPPGLEPGSLG